MNQGATPNSSMSRIANQRLWIFILGFSTLLCALLFTAGSGYANKKAPVATVPEAVVTALQLQSQYEQPHILVGLVESRQIARLGFEMSGQLQTMRVEEGDTFEEGEVLAQLDTSRLKARRTELQATLRRAKAQAKLAKLSESRLAPLVDTKAASVQQLDEAQARLSIATAQVAEVQAALQLINVELAKSQISAPFDGRIDSRLVSDGTVVSAGEPVFMLTDTSSLQCRFALPQNLADHVSVNQQVSVKTTNGAIPATITHILPSRNRQTRTVDILVALNNPSGALLAGDMVSIELTTSHSEQGAWVPVVALSNGLRGLWTLTIIAKDNEPVVQSRQVEVLYTDGERAFITGAIKDGDKVVIRGNQRFVPGQSVKVRDLQDGAAYD